MIKKIKIIVLLTIIYISILITVYWLHMKYMKVDVILYSALQDVLISLILFGFLQETLIKKYLNKSEKILILIIQLQLGVMLAISIPTIIDRSLSFYLLEKIQALDGIKKNQIENLIKNEYIHEFQVPETRINEQLSSKTVMELDGCIRLTSRGEKITKFSLFIRNQFLQAKNSEVFKLNESYKCEK